MNKILIVDDMPVNRKILKGLIQTSVNNVELLEAENGVVALEVVRTNRISLVVLDIMMPEKDGLEVLQEMKQDPQLSNIPVIMFTALGDQHNIEKALSLGALDYFTKPLTEEQMRITLPLKIRNALQYYEQKMELMSLYSGIKNELEAAKKLQKSLVSDNGIIDKYLISGKYYPCEDIGGDFYSCKMAGDRCWFIIADVVGHGISAAMGSAMLKVVFHNSIQFCETPEQVLVEINKTMLEIYGDADLRPLTAFVGCIEGERLHVANAGQPYPILFSHDQRSLSEINLNGHPLGVFEDITLEHAAFPFGKGDCIILYTDGMFDKGEPEGYANWSKIGNYCSKHIFSIASDSDQFVDDMLAHFAKTGGKFIDDAAILLVKKVE